MPQYIVLTKQNKIRTIRDPDRSLTNLPSNVILGSSIVGWSAFWTNFRNDKSLNWDDGSLKYQYNPVSNTITTTTDESKYFLVTIVDRSLRTNQDLELSVLYSSDKINVDSNFNDSAFLIIQEPDGDETPVRLNFTDGVATASIRLPANSYEIIAGSKTANGAHNVSIIGDDDFIVFEQ
jgi:hypothetical protein